MKVSLSQRLNKDKAFHAKMNNNNMFKKICINIIIINQIHTKKGSSDILTFRVHPSHSCQHQFLAQSQHC